MISIWGIIVLIIGLFIISESVEYFNNKNNSKHWIND